VTALTDDLMLLLLNPETGRQLTDGTSLPRALAGAVVLELVLDESIKISGPDGNVKPGRVVARAITHADPIANEALALIRNSKPMKPQPLVEVLVKALQPRVLERLQKDGQIKPRERRVLGVFPTTDWFVTPGSRREAVRLELLDALNRPDVPEQRPAALLSLLSAIGAVPKVFPEAEKKAVRKRAKEIAKGDWAAKAVRDAVASIEGAIMGAVVAASSVGAANS
jgi:hypothetical protein